MPTELYELTLTTLTYGGDALGRLEDPLTGPAGRAVFVPFGLPGERVRIRLTDSKRGFARGELVEVLEASPDRVPPRCKHFFRAVAADVSTNPQGTGAGASAEACGGCQYQHMSYTAQLKAKAGILRDQLQRIGRIENPHVREAVASPDPWNYRNHVQFHLTKKGELGYVRASSGSNESGSVLAIQECHLPEPAINSLWPQLEFEPDTGIGRVSLRAGADGELMLVLDSGSPDTPELEIEAGISVVHTFEESSVVIAGKDHLRTRVLDRDFHVSAASFFQVNSVMAEKIIHHLLANLPITPATNLLDVYCGAGLFSAFLAPGCKRVIGVESSPSACDDYILNLDEFDNVDLYEGRAEDVIPHLEVRPDIVLVDPPRAGLERGALDGIVRLNPRMVTYVSCDPSTLARDAGRLINGGFRLVEVTPFDLFPQTYHIESVSIFEKK
jgi:23S rRNA (uracil1939-C5)-methyltransferase